VLGQVSNLEGLDLSHNRIISIPEALALRQFSHPIFVILIFLYALECRFSYTYAIMTKLLLESLISANISLVM